MNHNRINKLSALIVLRNINVNTNICEMSSKFLMSDECGTHNARGFFCVLSRCEDIPVLRKELNDTPGDCGADSCKSFQLIRGEIHLL